MPLPKITTPTYELELPSTGKPIKYRPFLVKEEKILLMAMEEEKDAQLNRALKQVVNNCTFEKVDVGKLPLFDLEYIFLRIRAKSVGEVATVSVLMEDDNETYVPVEIDLESIEVQFSEGHTNKISLTDDISIVDIPATVLCLTRSTRVKFLPSEFNIPSPATPPPACSYVIPIAPK